MKKEESIFMTLGDLPAGRSAFVTNVGGEGELRQHLLDMGLTPSVRVTMVKHAPMGDPVEVRVHQYELTLRMSEASMIGVIPAGDEDEDASHGSVQDVSHPGFGEARRPGKKDGREPIPETETLRFALVGNQNCGKTTLFNQLTGANQHVGNFPGVTVDRKDGPIRGRAGTVVTDLPGIYSMSPYSPEEVITRRFVLEDDISGIIDIVDATNLERNLYLTMQLMELGKPMVLALNMMDEVRENGGTVKVNLLEDILGIPVVPISASRNEGVDELIDHAIHAARWREVPGRHDFCSPEDKDGAVHRCLHAIRHLIEDHAVRAGLPVSFAASKVCEGDRLMIGALGFDRNEEDALEHIMRQMEKEAGLDRAAAMADMRYSFIERVCSLAVVRPRVSKERERSMKADRILTGKWTAIPSFVLIMAAVFYLTFGVIGAWLTGLLETGIGALTGLVSGLMESAGVNAAVKSLVTDGILTGVGSVISFLPPIVCLFFFLSVLEDSGYMARVAFVMDKLLRKIGLSGRSIVPMLIGFGCTVPGIMASRTLPSERDRKMTVLLTPYMSCSAKLPIYAFISGIFFPGKEALAMILLYFGGIVVGIAAAAVLRRTAFRGEAVPFVMELPNYRMPGWKNVGMLLWEKSRDFLTRAFTVIFVSTIVIWFLETFSFRLNMVSDQSESMLSSIASLIAPVFSPIGFGDWRMVTALVAGFMAKESIVMTLSVLFGSSAAIASAMTPLGAASFLVFALLYTPCVAAVAAVKRELGGRWALTVVFGQLLVAWLASFVFSALGMALGF